MPLLPSRNGNGRVAGGTPCIVARYDYHDEAGELSYQVVRFDPKEFRQRRPDGNGGWLWDRKGICPILYRLRELVEADPAKTVYIVEGEKDADALAKLGLVVTCNSGGAGKWRPEYNSRFKDRNVVVLPDNDKPGREHANDVARSLSGIAKLVRLVNLPDLPAKGDVSDWIDAGGTSKQLRQIVAATPVVEPAAISESARDGRIADGDINEGERNETLFKLACRLREAGLTVESAERALLAENSARCKPPLPENEVREVVRSAMKGGSQGSDGSHKSAAILLAIATGGAELWHTPEGVAYATISVNGHSEHLKIRSKGFKEWLAKMFYDRTLKAPGSQTLQDVVNVLEGKAKHDSPADSVYLRIAEDNDRIYIDLADNEWCVIEVDAEGWRVVDDSPVRFRRTKGMLSLPTPEHGGGINELRPFVNVTDEGWSLTVSWLVAALRPTGPYPIVKLIGEQGSAKTTTAEVLRKIVDPNAALLRRPPHGDRDLMIAANNGWCIAFDNMSYVAPELSDALCSLATGGGFATRTLYSDDDETILVAERPIILNGIEDVGFRSDLLDRCLIVELPRIEPDRRLAEALFWRDFEEARPRILGALLDAVSAALRRLPAVRESGAAWPRMADFAQWGVAAEEALGLAPGQFLKAYEENRKTANQAALESSPVVIAINAMFGRKPGAFEGTAAELLEELKDDQDTRAKGWPKAPRVLSGMLSRIAPNLRAAGIEIEQVTSGSGNAKRKVWRIKPANIVDVTRSTMQKRRRRRSKTSDPCDPSDPNAPKTLAERIRAEGYTGR
jgi:hypothetical protein